MPRYAECEVCHALVPVAYLRRHIVSGWVEIGRTGGGIRGVTDPVFDDRYRHPSCVRQGELFQAEEYRT